MHLHLSPLGRGESSTASKPQPCCIQQLLALLEGGDGVPEVPAGAGGHSHPKRGQGRAERFQGVCLLSRASGIYARGLELAAGVHGVLVEPQGLALCPDVDDGNMADAADLAHLGLVDFAVRNGGISCVIDL